MILISIALYVLASISLMKIAEKLSIKNGWIGFIPIINNYLLGQFAEKSDEVFSSEKKRKWSKILLWCGIISGCLGFILTTVSAILAIIPYIGWIASAIIIGLYFPVSILLSVPVYFGYYKLFKMMAGKENAVWMLILVILVPVSYQILLAVFAFSGKYPVCKDPNAPVEGVAEEIPTEIPAEE